MSLLTNIQYGDPQRWDHTLRVHKGLTTLLGPYMPPDPWFIFTLYAQLPYDMDDATYFALLMLSDFIRSNTPECGDASSLPPMAALPPDSTVLRDLIAHTSSTAAFFEFFNSLVAMAWTSLQLMPPSPATTSIITTETPTPTHPPESTTRKLTPTSPLTPRDLNTPSTIYTAISELKHDLTLKITRDNRTLQAKSHSWSSDDASPSKRTQSLAKRGRSLTTSTTNTTPYQPLLYVPYVPRPSRKKCQPHQDQDP